MDIFQSFGGRIRARVTTADIPGLLDALSQRQIFIFHAAVLDELTLELELPRSGWRVLRKLTGQRGERLELAGRMGAYWKWKHIVNRPVLLFGVGVVIFLTFFLPSRVLFIEVEGNVSVPTACILEQTTRAGISFGVPRRNIRSEQLKNSLLEAIPQLQWAGINTNGCVATVSVRERAEEPESADSAGIGHIVAATDGVILSTNTLQGTCLCQPGQAVTRGQVLISGYTNLDRILRATRASGEIFAQTRRDFSAVTLSETRFRTQIQSTQEKYSLQIGKKRINFWKGSGICDTTCDRIYVEYCITLPGGFRLPVSVIRETVISYQTDTRDVDTEQARLRLETFSRAYVLSQTVSGQILSQSADYAYLPQVYRLEGTFLCQEMIGRFRQEKIGE